MRPTLDQSSGQVFREWTVGRRTLIPHKGDVDWSRGGSHDDVKGDRRWPRRREVRSLVCLATRTAARHIGQVTEEHIDVMPSRVQWLVWNFLVSRKQNPRGPCLHAWKLLSRSLLRADVKGGKPEDKPLGLYRYREHIARPTHPLSHYTQPLESPTLDFVTHLVLSGRCGFSVREMMCLSDMRNLGILEVIRPVDGTVSSTTSFSSSEYDEHGDGADQEAAAAAMTFPPLTDRLVRAWAEKEDPFPRLRVLRVWGVGTTTRESLRWVAALPALVVYDVLGKPESWESEADVAGDGGEWERLMPSGDEASLVEQLVAAGAAATGAAADVSRKWQSGMDGNTANRVDRELVSAYMHDGDGDGDGEPSRSATVRFVDYGEALRLVDAPATAAAADEAPRTVRGMIDATDSEAWAFWMYALIGQVRGDADLKERRPAFQATADRFVLPSRPTATLILGPDGRRRSGGRRRRWPTGTKQFLWTRRKWGVREAFVPEGHVLPKSTKVETRGRNGGGGGGMRGRKRKMGDMLGSMM